ncbi:hypothetical protein LCGC14_2996990 [marine sediment metagenome]|uniref:Uncharacterized protein n=1 Tax=marine sediment metagenome TaxID=412755 RepID=A0A0F8ZTA1_9ZZZZ
MLWSEFKEEVENAINDVNLEDVNMGSLCIPVSDFVQLEAGRQVEPDWVVALAGMTDHGGNEKEYFLFVGSEPAIRQDMAAMSGPEALTAVATNASIKH